MTLNLIGLPENIKKELNCMLKLSVHNPPELDDMWKLIDYAWEECGCDNKHINVPKLNKFYKHPVWTLNGLFIEQHTLSIQHRKTMATWITHKKLKNILDFGGGFGTFARLISEKDGACNIDIYEPYYNELAVIRNSKYPNINYLTKVTKKYDCIVSVSVLEHVPNPLELLAIMVQSLKINGYLIIANDFTPVIKCHLPSTFHFRYTFRLFACMMGLKKIKKCAGSHASIYQKSRALNFNWKKIKICERISKETYKIYNIPLIYIRKKVFNKV